MSERQTETRNKSPHPASPGLSPTAGPMTRRKTRARYDPGGESRIDALMRGVLSDHGRPLSCPAADCRRHRHCIKPLQPHRGPSADLRKSKHRLPPCVMDEPLRDVIDVHRCFDVMLAEFERGPPVLTSAAQLESLKPSTVIPNEILSRLRNVMDHDDPVFGDKLRAWKLYERKLRKLLKRRVAAEASQEKTSNATTGDEA